MYLLILFPMLGLALNIFSQAHAAPERLLYSIPWREAAQHSLEPELLERVQYMIDDAEWNSATRRSYDGAGYSRPQKGATTGEQELDKLMANAVDLDDSAVRATEVMLRLSRPQRPLSGYTRGGSAHGTMILNSRQLGTDGAIRNSIVKSLVTNQKDAGPLLMRLAERVLANPEDVALTEALTSVIAAPEIWHLIHEDADFIRDFLLLMSVHPVPDVKMSALFALAPYILKNQFVHQTLVAEAEERTDVFISKANVERVTEVVGELSNRATQLPNLTDWSAKVLNLYRHWFDNPMIARASDYADYNVLRLAQSAAGHALFWVAGEGSILHREFILEQADGRTIAEPFIEKTEMMCALPSLRRLEQENGTGFHIRSLLGQESDNVRYSNGSVYSAPFLVDPCPHNMWILMGMEPEHLVNYYGAVLSGGQLAHHGHGTSLRSWLRHSALGMPPDEGFWRISRSFHKRLLEQVQAEVAKYAAMGVRVLALSQVEGDLADQKLATNVVSFPAEPAAPLDDIKSYVNGKTLFTSSLKVLFAARALALLGEKDEAAAVLLGLLPNRWSLDVDEQAELVNQINLPRSQAVRAQLTEATKSYELNQLLSSFYLVWPRAKARAILLGWSMRLQDPTLAAEVRKWIALRNCKDQLS